MRLGFGYTAHHLARARGAGGVSTACLALCIGCSLFESHGPRFATAPRETGSVRVTAMTTGTDLDADGYGVTVDGTRLALVPANGSVMIEGLGLGLHTLQVAQVAPNCALDGAGPRSVNVGAAGDTVDVAVAVACSAFGSVQVTVVTTGTDLDPNGYRVEASAEGFFDQESGIVPANGAVALRGLAAGAYVLRIGGLAGNCGGPDLLPRPIAVVSGGEVAVTFQVSCAAPERIAFVVVATPPGNTDIWVIGSDGTGAMPLTDHPAADADPAFSPDGTRIAFTSARDGVPAVHVMVADGSGVTRLTSAEGASYRPAWSPDGRRIAFVGEREGNTDVYVMSADGTNLVRLTTHLARDEDPAWSPDGTRIAFASGRDGASEIYVMNADGSGVTRVTTNDTWDGQPAWSPDGSRLAFSRTLCYYGWGYGCYQAVIVAGAPGSGVATSIEVGIGEDPMWSSDGSRIAVTRLVCDLYYYGGCDVDGIGILSPSLAVRAGIEGAGVWDALTTGTHTNPAWRP